MHAPGIFGPTMPPMRFRLLSGIGAGQHAICVGAASRVVCAIAVHLTFLLGAARLLKQHRPCKADFSKSVKHWELKLDMLFDYRSI